MSDNVIHPDHYTTGGIECIDAIRASMTPEEFCGYLKGCAIKYLWRYRHKGKPVEDLEKARNYTRYLIEELQPKEDPAAETPDKCEDCPNEYRCDWDRDHCQLKSTEEEGLFFIQGDPQHGWAVNSKGIHLFLGGVAALHFISDPTYRNM